MLPIRFVIKLDQISEFSAAESFLPVTEDRTRPRIREIGTPTISIRAVEGPADREGVATVARRCQETDPDLSGRFAAEGLLAEIAERPGRRGRGWVAWQIGGNHDAGAANAVGLIILMETLVKTPAETRQPSGPRFSVAWLLVDPVMRRRGLATALVGEAVRHVRSLGGTEIEAETLAGWSAAAAFWRRFAGGRPDPGPGHRSVGTRGA